MRSEVACEDAARMLLAAAAGAHYRYLRPAQRGCVQLGVSMPLPPIPRIAVYLAWRTERRSSRLVLLITRRPGRPSGGCYLVPREGKMLARSVAGSQLLRQVCEAVCLSVSRSARLIRSTER